MICHMPATATFSRLGRAVTRRPWLVIAGWLLGAGCLIAFAPGLGSVTTADQAAFLPGTAESSRAAELARRAFPDAGGSTAVVVVQRRDRAPLTDADLATAARLGPPQISENRAVALVPVRFPGPAEAAATQHAVHDLRASTAGALQDTGLVAGVTGEAAIAVDNAGAFADAEKIVTLATLALIVVLLLLIFRSPVAALLPLLTVGLVYGVSAALVALVGHALDRQVGQELPTMLTVVLFGIGTDYVLFLLFRFRERLRAGDPPGEAIVAAVERVGAAIGSAAFAVIAAFGALVLATLGFFATIGPALAIGVAVMLLAALTLVPATVAVLGRWTFWPSRGPRPGRGGFARLGRLVARRPALVVAGSVLVLGALAAGVPRFVADYDPIGVLPAGTEAATAFGDLQRGFPAGAVQPTTVYLTADHALTEAETAAFTQRLAAVDGVASPMPPRVAGDGRTVAVPLVLAATPYSAEALDLVGGPLRDAARTAAPAGTSAVVGGPTMAFADVRAATDRDLMVIFPVAALLFALILAGLLRAALAPVYLVALVVTTFVATLGATAWLFQGLAFSIPIILYLFVTAIGTDYNILVTARLREEIREGRSPREAAGLAVARAGPTVGAAGVILAGTFGALLISGVPFFIEIGFAVMLGILLAAFVVSSMLVPAITALAGRAAWWPGLRPDRAHVETIVIKEEARQGERFGS